MVHSLSERCRAILRCADDLPSKTVARELGLHEHTLGKWRRRFLKDRLQGLLEEARLGKPRTIDDDQVAAVIDRTLCSRPIDATHWSIRSMGAASGFSHTNPQDLDRLRPAAASLGWRGGRTIMSTSRRHRPHGSTRSSARSRSLHEAVVLQRPSIDQRARSRYPNFIDRHNENPKPYRWTKSADEILTSVKRFCQKTQRTLCSEL